jgi:UDPglucose 6-dehydrogenase
VTGAVFADLGHRVWGVDKDAQKIDSLTGGRVPVYEPGLKDLIAYSVAQGRLAFSTDLGYGVRSSEMIFIAVETPFNGDLSSNLSAVEEIARGIALAMDGYKVIVLKSTVPVGTAELVRRIIVESQPAPVPFDVVSNPDFLRQGSAVHDARFPDRIIIGAANRAVAIRLLEIYAPLGRSVIITDIASAEMIRHASNAFLAAKISFINAIADLCEGVGADVAQVAKGMALDPRIGAEFLQAGLGFGGACFVKDTAALIFAAVGLGCDVTLLKSVLEVNRRRVGHLMEKLRKVLDPLDGKVVGLFGLAFKPNTDDVRHAKSMELVEELHEAGAQVRAYDPVATDNARPLLPSSVRLCGSPYEAAAGASGVVLATEWDEFRSLDFGRLRGAMARPLVVDGRNFYDPARMRRLGFEYHSMGRSPV